MPTDATPSSLPSGYSARIKQFRARLGLTQVELAARLGVSFATVNRWENGQTTPSPLSWQQLVRMDEGDASVVPTEQMPVAPPVLDFTGSPQVVRALAEGERLSFGHMFNPAFATEISQIDPLPHQITAVYQSMLPRQPLRFLLADDPGAGKTIMAGLLIKELMARGDVQRCLICAPGNLADQWQDEMWYKFQMRFEILTRETYEAAVSGNAFLEKDRAIIRLDQVARDEGLQENARLVGGHHAIPKTGLRYSTAHFVLNHRPWNQE